MKKPCNKSCWSHGHGWHTDAECKYKKDSVGLDDIYYLKNPNSMCYTLSENPNPLKYIATKGDIAASKHYWQEEDEKYLKIYKITNWIKCDPHK